MKHIIMFLAITVCALLLSFTFGGDSYTIHLNNKQVAQYYVMSKDPLPDLSLTTGDKTSTLAVYYSECGKIGRERSLILKNEKKEVLKTWNFPNAMDEHKPMTLNTTEVLGLIKSEKAYLYYSSREVNHTQILASVVSSLSPSAKK